MHSQSETRITARLSKEKNTYNLFDFWMNADEYAAKRISKDAKKIWKEVSMYEEQFCLYLQCKLPHELLCYLSLGGSVSAL